MAEAYLNRIETAAPPHDIHGTFIKYIPTLLSSEQDRKRFRLLAHRAQIEHRYSFLKPHPDATQMDANGFYQPGNFPDTETRMRFYKEHAFTLAKNALDKINLTDMKDDITHLIITTCTGFYAPGIDLQIMQHYSLNPAVERTVIGFMGCQAAINALKLARHIVRSDSGAKVVILNLELCTLHLQETDDLQQLLAFLIFADGCSASLVSAAPQGLELQSFYSSVMPDSKDQITWHIGGLGFDMMLSRLVPSTIADGLPTCISRILGGRTLNDTHHWAVHPGGKAILDAVRTGAELDENVLVSSRRVLREFGNMSSATVMFVLKDMMDRSLPSGNGCAMSFGPGLTVESMLFQN